MVVVHVFGVRRYAATRGGKRGLSVGGSVFTSEAPPLFCGNTRGAGGIYTGESTTRGFDACLCARVGTPGVGERRRY